MFGFATKHTFNDFDFRRLDIFFDLISKCMIFLCKQLVYKQLNSIWKNIEQLQF